MLDKVIELLEELDIDLYDIDEGNTINGTNYLLFIQDDATIYLEPNNSITLNHNGTSWHDLMIEDLPYLIRGLY